MLITILPKTIRYLAYRSNKSPDKLSVGLRYSVKRTCGRASHESHAGSNSL
jgi:hypothetical protein